MGNNIHILNHPLLQHKLSILRDEHTGTNEFRKVVSEIASLMTYEATRDLPTRDVDVKTPVDVAHCKVLAGKKIAIVPILRAGLGMVDGVLEMLPTAKVGHIGLYRDPETLDPVEYYCKMPQDIAERDILIVDPMRFRCYRLHEELRLQEHQDDEHHRRSRRRRAYQQGASRCRCVCGFHGPVPERPRLHRPRPGRCWRPDLRYQVRERI